MKNIKALIALAAMITILGACGGGGGSTSTGGVYMSHDQVAQEFVRRVNLDLGYDVELVKSTTLQYDYIVVYDWDYGTYDAYYIGDYNVGENLSAYLNTYYNSNYWDLIPESGNTYRDYWTGILFEKANVTGKNLTTAKAFAQELAITKAAKQVHAKYGLSEDKSLDVARFAYKIQTSPAGTYKMSDYDNFAKELTGSTITEFQNDIKEGKMISLTERIQTAAETTGMGPEAMNSLIKDVFME
jgi:hypothetical protein